jgi:demethylmenaquinone methyltransferase/2-methoxy-6-polyprenyl-1,4-benzoquinol methylase
MANRFYAEGEQRAAKVHDLFAAIAPRYDRINDIQSFGLHRYWKRRVIRLSGMQPGDDVLDLCCGTGDLALALARAGGRVVGLDFSEPMLAVARARAAREAQRGRSVPIQWVQGDAMDTPFPDGAFQVITIAYGLRNLASCERGVREFHRLLRPGGRVVVLDFGKPDNGALRAIYFAYLRLVVPIFGRVFCGNAAAYSYILESLRHYPAQRGVDALMKAATFRQTSIVNLMGGTMSLNIGVR